MPIEDGAETSEVRRQARKAGRLYFVMALLAPIGLLLVPNRIFVAGDPAATAENLRSSELLVRVGLATDVVHQVLCVFLLLALYRVFEPVSRELARQLIVLGALLSVPVVFANGLNDLAALAFAKGGETLAAFDRAQLDALAYTFLRLHARGVDVASIFWGLWLFPFARLVLRCGFIPRIFGHLLGLAGIGYLANAFATFVVPQLLPWVNPVSGLLNLGEVPIIFWLLIRGARAPELATAK